MRLGLIAGYWGAGPPANALDAILAADELEWTRSGPPRRMAPMR